MSRPCRARVQWMLVLVLAAGCQSYNFNPVGHCLIQPGGKQYTLSSISTADVLFVVDDSGSMSAEQQRLAANFSAFINNLDQTNAARAAAGLDAIDFHIAVTTTSIFWNFQTATTCRSDCSDATGLVCCVNSTNKAARQPQSCTTPGSSAGCTAGTCRTDCNGLQGEPYCCDPTTKVPAQTAPIACSRAGTACGTYQRHFSDPLSTACDQGVAAPGYPYARGAFVSWSDPAGGAGVNPRVLHFDKRLYPQPVSATATLDRGCTTVATCSTGEVCVAATTAAGAPKFCRTSCTTTCAAGYTCVASACQPTNSQGFTSQQLVNFFAGSPAGANANVTVGTCGSGEEQGLEAARLALVDALAGRQKDTYDVTGAKKWTPATRVADAAATWPHDNSKLVLVFIGDEDDCSSPDDPSGGVVMDTREPGDDACVHDGGAKEYDVATRFVDYFTGLGRPVGAAFIESAAQTQCGYFTYGACTAGVCCQENCPTAGVCSSSTVNYCGGQAAGLRFFDAAGKLREKGADVVTGSVCDGSFDALLNQIAEIVKPPSGLELPTLPASDAITVLRIARPDGTTRRLCGRPAPGGMTQADAIAAGYEWWFTATSDPGAPVAVSRYVYMNPSGACVANPGETYSAEYIGKLPESGCGDGGGVTGDEMCQQVLGGSAGSWTCYAPGSAGSCGPTTFDAGTQTGTGTCICGSRAENCPP